MKPGNESGARSPREMFVVISYDIPDDRRRLRVMKLLEGYGRRVQYSVFECRLTVGHLREVERRLARVIRAEEDDVRFYVLCRGCQKMRRGLGRGQPEEEKGYVVV